MFVLVHVYVYVCVYVCVRVHACASIATTLVNMEAFVLFM